MMNFHVLLWVRHVLKTEKHLLHCPKMYARMLEIAQQYPVGGEGSKTFMDNQKVN